MNMKEKKARKKGKEGEQNGRGALKLKVEPT